MFCLKEQHITLHERRILCHCVFEQELVHNDPDYRLWLGDRFVASKLWTGLAAIFDVTLLGGERYGGRLQQKNHSNAFSQLISRQGSLTNAVRR